MARILGRTIVPVVVGAALGVAAVGQVAGGGALAAAVQHCGGGGNTVQAAFEIKEARSIWDHLPALGITPELEADTRPAEVVVFAGPYKPTRWPSATAQRRRRCRVWCASSRRMGP